MVVSQVQLAQHFGRQSLRVISAVWGLSFNAIDCCTFLNRSGRLTGLAPQSAADAGTITRESDKWLQIMQISAKNGRSSQAGPLTDFRATSKQLVLKFGTRSERSRLNQLHAGERSARN